jgi:hypothetical protein
MLLEMASIDLEFKTRNALKNSFYYIMHGGVGVQMHFHVINKLYIWTSAGENCFGPSWNFYVPLTRNLGDVTVKIV